MGDQELDGGDGIAVTVDNANGNKIDAYLEMTVDYAPMEPDAQGKLRSTATVTLTNNAPAEGLPNYVIGNALRLNRRKFVFARNHRAS